MSRRDEQERIARLMGSTAYRDIREGFGGSVPATLTDQDIAAAVGMVNTRLGRHAGMVLETHFCGSDIHLDALMRVWEGLQSERMVTREDIVLTRFSAELAIRELGSQKYGTPQLSRFAYLIHSRRERLQARMDDCKAWLLETLDEATIAFRSTVREAHDSRRKSERIRQAA